MEDRKAKKPTKKQILEQIPVVMEQELKSNYIKNMVMGFELGQQMILDYINNGHNIEEVKEFVTKNLVKENSQKVVDIAIKK